MLGIAVEDSRAAVTEFAKESKLAFPIALDLNSTVKRVYRIFGPPATFFIARELSATWFSARSRRSAPARR